MLYKVCCRREGSRALLWGHHYLLRRLKSAGTNACGRRSFFLCCSNSRISITLCQLKGLVSAANSASWGFLKRQTIRDLQRNCSSASGNTLTQPSKKRQFFFHIVMYVLDCCSLERWQRVGFWLKQQHIFKQQKQIQTELEKTSVSWKHFWKKHLLPGNCPNDDLLAIQETCFSGTTSG